MATKKLKAAILGFGGMGHCHAAQYEKQKDVKLVALCDIDPSKFTMENVALNFGDSGKADVNALRCYTSYEELIAGEPDLDYIDICLPSDLHCEYSCRAMKDGFNVLCEKPMALNTKDCDKMIKTSYDTGKLLMIAQCLRFSDSFNMIRKFYENGKYGKLLRFSLHRMGGFPEGWFRDVTRSGGALMDLHIHDIDFVMYMLGKPDSLRARGAVVVSGGVDDLGANLIYKDGPIVDAESSWARGGWQCGMAAVFEKATVRTDGGDVIVYEADKPLKTLKPKNDNMYFNEIAYFAKCVKINTRPEVASIESTRETIRILLLETKSALSNGKLIKL
ncbi:MAG: Gfo/Idh/MocA family oxidoreductase [Kiritimatiellae bacterium]|nr:Gfo/Idh/MocA family oxidoreductase [Kiritimatiellia bacterium]